MSISILKNKDAKIIFVDIDGTINDHHFYDEAKSTMIDPECVVHLNYILEKTGAYIVLSSAWRYMIIGRAMSLTGFEYLLRTHGVMYGRLVGMTCADEEVSERGWQIHDWRKKYDHTGKYVVIDDMDFHISKLHPFVQTNSDIGLTEEDAKKAIAILNE